ncbi:MAG: hypothetical protein J5698_07280 [Bacteroidaceae bacterium]|nr:hypothetical protein [Bacteroidaceae bacterium]
MKEKYIICKHSIISLQRKQKEYKKQSFFAKKLKNMKKEETVFFARSLTVSKEEYPREKEKGKGASGRRSFC